MLVPTLTELRKAKGLTQQQLADKIGVSKNTITRWEMNENKDDPKNSIRPRGPARIALGLILGWDPDDIQYGTATKEEGPPDV